MSIIYYIQGCVLTLQSYNISNFLGILNFLHICSCYTLSSIISKELFLQNCLVILKHLLQYYQTTMKNMCQLLLNTEHVKGHVMSKLVLQHKNVDASPNIDFRQNTKKKYRSTEVQIVTIQLSCCSESVKIRNAILTGYESQYSVVEYLYQRHVANREKKLRNA